MDIKLMAAVPTDDERAAVDGVLGAPASAWDGGARGSDVDYHSALGGHAARERRHLLVPALQALQARIGWISEGGMNYVCTRLAVPPAEAWGVATFYALLAVSPRPRRVLHVCDDVACRNAGARELCAALERAAGPALGHAAHGHAMALDAARPAWMRSPCLGMCDHAPAALVTEAGERPREALLGGMTAERARALLAGGAIGADASDPWTPSATAGDPFAAMSAPGERRGGPPVSQDTARAGDEQHRSDAGDAVPTHGRASGRGAPPRAQDAAHAADDRHPIAAGGIASSRRSADAGGPPHSQHAAASPAEHHRSAAGIVGARDAAAVGGPPPDSHHRADGRADPHQSPAAGTAAPHPSLLARVGVVDPTSLAAYREAGGYAALARAFDLGPEGIIAELTASRLVGRGGAAFPTGRKWDAVRQASGTPRWVVCNADESEPGTFKDRVLLTGDPFAIVEAMTVAGLAVGAERGVVYVRAEYPLAHERLANAIAQARAAGLLGDDVMRRGLRFDVELRRGAGAYICGEETALFESIEGKRGEPRSKPPFPVHVGLFGGPTVVNNVETLANVLPILLHGGDAFARVGTAGSTGTRLFCLSGAVRRPGVYEVPYGATLGELLERAGGLPDGRTLQAVLLGGAAGTFVRPDELGLRLTLEDARAALTTLGSGVVMAFDDRVDLTDVVLRIAAFFRDESCGQCVPCRVGTVRQEEALHRIVRGPVIGSVERELALLHEVGIAMRDASICGLGQTAYSAVESAVRRLALFGPPPAPTELPA